LVFMHDMHIKDWKFMNLKMFFKSGMGVLLGYFFLILICATISFSMIGKVLLMQLVLWAPLFWIFALVLGIKNFSYNKTFSIVSITVSILLLSVFIILNLIALYKGLGIDLIKLFREF